MFEKHLECLKKEHLQLFIQNVLRVLIKFKRSNLVFGLLTETNIFFLLFFSLSFFEKTVLLKKRQRNYCESVRNANKKVFIALLHLVPRNGEWGSFGQYTTCTKTCGGGTQYRTRGCNNPAPANGGRPCVGQSFQKRTCANNPCDGMLSIRSQSICQSTLVQEQFNCHY